MPPLTSDVWQRRGHSLLWNAQALFALAPPQDTVTLRQFFALVAQWPDDLPANEGRTLIVVGLEGVLDSLSPDDAAEWLENDLQETLRAFQSAYDEAALIFWLPSGQRRLKANPARPGLYHWICAAPHSDTPLDLGRLLWGGAVADTQHILDPAQPNADPDGPAWMGLYLARLS